MSELTPITRIESYLDAIVNSGIPPTEDITRIETFLQAIYDNQVCQLTPITRIEMFLGKISGQDIELPQPITRIELYLAAIAGEDVELPENPITRLEMYLAEWADSGDWTTISGAIVEFITQRAHKLRSCVVTLSPKQDLHGYDSPWPAGGGVNKLQPLVDGFYPCYIPAGTEVTVSCNIVEGSSSVFYYNQNKTRLDYWSIINLYDSNKRKYRTFTITADAYYFNFADNNSEVQVELGATPSQYKPISNICPISGWTGCEVWRTGKNLADMISDGYVPSVFNGALVPYNGARSQYIKVNPNTTYAVSFEYNTYNVVVQYDINKDFIRADSGVSTVTTTATTEYVMLRCDFPVEVTAIPKCQFELGATVTDYEEYRGNNYSVTFGKTVYGGYDEIVSGQGKDQFVKLNMADIQNWYVQTDIGRIYVILSDLEGWADPNTPDIDLYCNRFKTVSFSDVYGGGADGVALSIGKALQFRISGLTDDPSTTLQDIIAYFAANETYVVAKLATPTDITTTPTPITALKGYNIMWSDGDSIEVTVHGTPVEVETLQALNMLLGGAYHNNQTADDVSDDEALDIILGGEQR